MIAEKNVVAFMIPRKPMQQREILRKRKEKKKVK
jgi:hypothetical protein